MRSTRRAWLATIVATGTLAGCLGDDDGDDGGDGDGGGTSDGGSATVEVAEHDDLGDVLVNGDGMVLYMFDSDEQGAGASTCTEGCLDAWPPLTVDGDVSTGDDVSATVETFERADGSTQVQADGWPLYYYAQDESAGDATGQGANEVWWVLRPDGTPVRESGSGSSGETSEEGGGGDAGGDDGSDGGGGRSDDGEDDPTY